MTVLLRTLDGLEVTTEVPSHFGMGINKVMRYIGVMAERPTTTACPHRAYAFEGEVKNGLKVFVEQPS